MLVKKILSSLVVAGLLTTVSLANSQSTPMMDKPSAKVQMMIEKFKLQVVDFNYVKNVIGKGTKKSAKAILVDARPNAKFIKGTIPTSINIPDTDYDKYIGQLKDTPKNKEIIVFCGGWECGKSPKVANMLKKDGFTNVKLYQAGEPEWSKKTYVEVDIAVARAAYKNNSAVLIDARPYAKFLQETIPGAIAIPDTQVEDLKGRFPVHQMEKVIVFCGGFECAKSHKVAKKMVSMGYKNVSVFAGGVPQWKKEKLPTTKATGMMKSEKPKKATMSKNGLKLGVDEGSVDGEWLLKYIKEGNVPSFIQIVDVTSPEEYKAGHIKGAINIEAEKLKANEFYAKLPKGKTIVFNCTAGGRSIDAWMKLKNAKYDISEIYYFDANVSCKGEECKITVNEPLE
jgi:rhodanese-related sulfurtransferase